MFQQSGILFILSGPSGVGKGTVRKALFEAETELKYSVSATTRDKREGEIHGQDYFFTSVEDFEAMIENNQMLEHASYVGNYYGTPRTFVEEQLARGHDVFLEIEVQGALQVKENFPEGVFIFLFPPSIDELRRRIVDRGTESKRLVNHRLHEAKKEIRMMREYDYVVVNDNVTHAVQKVRSIIQSEHCKRTRVEERYKNILEENEC